MPKLTTVSRTKARADLRDMGITGAAAESYLDATGPDRQAARIARFVRCALGEWKRAHHMDQIPERSLTTAALYGIAVLSLDAFGIVASNGPTEATTKYHHHAFRSDCGSRIGFKSFATFAAQRAAMDELWRTATYNTTSRLSLITITPATDGVTFTFNNDMQIILHVEPTKDADSQHPSWIKTIALEGMRRSLGASPWFQLMDERHPHPHEKRPSPHPFEIMTIAGVEDAWASVVQLACDREATDRLGAEVLKFVDEHKTTGIFKFEPQRWRRVSQNCLISWATKAFDSDVQPIIDCISARGSAQDLRTLLDERVDKLRHG